MADLQLVVVGIDDPDSLARFDEIAFSDRINSPPRDLHEASWTKLRICHAFAADEGGQWSLF